MKKIIIAALAFTTFTVLSCRQEEILSSEEVATLNAAQRLNDKKSIDHNNGNTQNDSVTINDVFNTTLADGEIAPPPRK